MQHAGLRVSEGQLAAIEVDGADHHRRLVVVLAEGDGLARDLLGVEALHFLPPGRRPARRTVLVSVELADKGGACGLLVAVGERGARTQREAVVGGAAPTRARHRSRRWRPWSSWRSH